MTRINNISKNIFVAALLLLMFNACRKGDFKDNIPPDTKISVDTINRIGDNRLNSQVHLSWYGSDRDGYIKGYEISLDNQNWSFTTATDSTFLFKLQAGQDTTDINFYVRAIDDKDARDPSPAYLRVPLKNSPPVASFNNDRGPKDTAFVVSTFFYSSSDPDGASTIKKAFIKFNSGNWVEINPNQNLLSFVVDTAVQSGTATAELYYAKNHSSENITVDGLKVNDENVAYVKVVDLAGAESKVDTSDSFFLKNKTPGVNTLMVTGHSAAISLQYRGYLDVNNIQYDFLNYGADQGARQPVYWDPTFSLILKLYDRVFIDAPSTTFLNPVTGQNSTLLDYIAPMIQDFYNNGKKSFITTAFDKNQDVSGIVGPFPIEGIVNSSGQVRCYPDSTVYPVINTSVYPDLKPTNIQSSVSPIIKSVDAEEMYRAEITPFGGWQGDNLVAVERSPGNQLRQVFFSIELHKYDGIPGSVENLIGEIFNNEF